VVAPGETLMQIVPGHDRIVVDAKVLPQDVDQVAIGQQAIVRLSAFSQQTTPEVSGRVETVSADLVRDPTAVMAEPPFYAVRVRLSESDIAALGGVKLLPGMPAEIHLQTGSRSALSYFMKPLTDQFSRAFREQ
jgi:HlyD family secretion protein